jgi:hypothetical protein
MKIKISNNTKVYVACPANKATGGPELLHQLVFELRKLGISAYMFYFDGRFKKTLIHPSYRNYKNPYVVKVTDSKENVLIVPELNTNLLSNFKNIYKVIWWLSVDNYKSWIKPKIFSKIYFYKCIFFYKFFLKDFVLSNHYALPIHHFVQSHYALNYLLKNNVKRSYISYLSDYLNQDFIKFSNKKVNKANIVAYNPSKGFKFTKKLISQSNNINFVPIVNMGREEVIKLLQKSKVYIDFGNHPGKDRIPREAAICGCCVITNKNGSAKYFKDLPIKNEYKLEGLHENIPTILNLINDCFDNYQKRVTDFDEYRDYIKSEHSRFIQNLSDIFTIKR